MLLLIAMTTALAEEPTLEEIIDQSPESTMTLDEIIAGAGQNSAQPVEEPEEPDAERTENSDTLQQIISATAPITLTLEDIVYGYRLAEPEPVSQPSEPSVEEEVEESDQDIGRQLDVQVAQNTIAENIGRIEYCYNTLLARDRLAGGTVQLTVVVDAGGKARAIAVGMDSSMTDCLETQIGQMDFNAPDQPIQFVLPLTFVPPDSASSNESESNDSDSMPADTTFESIKDIEPLDESEEEAEPIEFETIDLDRFEEHEELSADPSPEPVFEPESVPAEDPSPQPEPVSEPAVPVESEETSAKEAESEVDKVDIPLMDEEIVEVKEQIKGNIVKAGPMLKERCELVARFQDNLTHLNGRLVIKVTVFAEGETKVEIVKGVNASAFENCVVETLGSMYYRPPRVGSVEYIHKYRAFSNYALVEIEKEKTPTEMVMAEVSRRQQSGAFRGCEDLAFKMDNKSVLDGQMTIVLTIPAVSKGEPKARVKTSSLESFHFEGCMVAELGSGYWPRPSEGATIVEVPFKYHNQEVIPEAGLNNTSLKSPTLTRKTTVTPVEVPKASKVGNIEEVVTMSKSRYQTCMLTGGDTRPKGRMEIDVRVYADGMVSTGLKSSTIGNNRFETCVIDRVGELDGFDTPPDGYYEATVSLIF